MNILKLFCWRIWYMYDMICNIRCNYIMSVDKNVNFVIVHSLWGYMKYFISLNINSLYILYYNDSLVPKWGLMWFNGIGTWRNPILLLETILVPTQWALIILVKNSNMPCIYLLSLAHCLYIYRMLKVHPCVHVKSSFHLIWNMVWHLCKRVVTRHTILFIGWTWRLTRIHHIRKVDVSLIWGVTKLVSILIDSKLLESNSLLYGVIVRSLPL